MVKNLSTRCMQYGSWQCDESRAAFAELRRDSSPVADLHIKQFRAVPLLLNGKIRSAGLQSSECCAL